MSGSVFRVVPCSRSSWPRCPPILRVRGFCDSTSISHDRTLSPGLPPTGRFAGGGRSRPPVSRPERPRSPDRRPFGPSARTDILRVEHARNGVKVDLTWRNAGQYMKDFHVVYEAGLYDDLVQAANAQLPPNIGMLRPTEFVSVAHHLSRAKYSNPSFWNKFNHAIVPALFDLEPKDGVLLLNSMCTLQIELSHHRTIIEVLSEEMVHMMPASNAYVCALLLNSWGRLMYDNKAAWKAVCARVRMVKPTLLPIDVSGILNALGRLNIKPRRFLAAIAARLSTDLSSVSADYAPSMLAAFRNLSFVTRDVEEWVKANIPKIAHDLKPSDLCMSLSALAKMEVKSAEALEPLVTVGEAMLKRNVMDSRNVVTLFNAMCKIGFEDRVPLWKALMEQVESRLGRFSDEDVATVVLSAAKIDGLPSWRRKLFQTVSEFLPPRVFSYSPRSLSNLLIAYAKVDICDPSLFGRISASALTKVNDFNCWDVTETLRAFSFFEFQDDPLFSSVCGPGESAATAF